MSQDLPEVNPRRLDHRPAKKTGTAEECACQANHVLAGGAERLFCEHAVRDGGPAATCANNERALSGNTVWSLLFHAQPHSMTLSNSYSLLPPIKSPTIDLIIRAPPARCSFLAQLDIPRDEFVALPAQDTHGTGTVG